MKKYVILSVIIALLFTACKNKTAAEAEIRIPVYGGEGGGNGYEQTYTVKTTDLFSERTVAAKFGCPFAETVVCGVSGNLTEVNPSRKEYRQGEVIAVINPSETVYERAGVLSAVNSAEARYKASGAERDRLLWLIELEELNRLDYQIEKHTVTAPYDCVVVSPVKEKAGDYVAAGHGLCEIAKIDEIFVYVGESPELFAEGKAVKIGMGSFTYKGEVAASPLSAPPYSNAARELLTVIKPLDGEIQKIFADTPGALAAGWATVYVTETDMKNVITVPDSAVTRTMNGSYCTLIQNGLNMRVEVVTGISAGGYTVILGGLFDGDAVAVIKP